MPSRITDSPLTLDQNPLTGKASTKVDEKPEEVASGGPGAGAPESLSRTPIEDGERKVDWIEFELVDQTGAAVPGAIYQVVLSDGSTREGILDQEGRVRFNGIEPGSCSIRFPTFDADDWR